MARPKSSIAEQKVKRQESRQKHYSNPDNREKQRERDRIYQQRKRDRAKLQNIVLQSLMNIHIN